MSEPLKKTTLPRPPANVKKEKRMADFRKKRVQPIPDQVFPAISPLVVQGIKLSGRLLNRPSEPQPKFSPYSSHKSVSQEQKQKQKPGTLKLNGLKKQNGKKKKEPLGVAEAIKKYGSRLTEFELEEILGYSEIWYLGLKAVKIPKYDDAKGYYMMVAHDHIAYRYEVLEVMGQGAFGQVLRCRDHKTNETVAIKVLRRMKDYPTSMTEVKILKALLKKEKDTSTIQMKDHFIFRKHLCITFELLGSNLNDILHRRHRQGLSKKLIRHYARSMLKCLQVLHDEKIIHADLKPENILAIDTEHSDIKVADFGCGCYEDEQVFNYIGTRWYRAPELLLNQPYGTAIDMWSFGCVLAELHTGWPIFTGKNELDQLSCIMEVLGMPPIDEKSEFWTAFFARKWKHKTSGTRHPKSRPLASILGSTDQDFLDFVRRCLTWEPKVRMTPLEAMQHKWIMEGRQTHYRTHEQPKDSTEEPSHDHLRTHDPHRTNDQLKDSTGEPSFPNPGPGPLRKGGHKAFCDKRLARIQNVYNPMKISSLNLSVKRPP